MTTDKEVNRRWHDKLAPVVATLEVVKIVGSCRGGPDSLPDLVGGGAWSCHQLLCLGLG